jgi:hypothetical protein
MRVKPEPRLSRFNFFIRGRERSSKVNSEENRRGRMCENGPKGNILLTYLSMSQNIQLFRFHSANSLPENTPLDIEIEFLLIYFKGLKSYL